MTKGTSGEWGQPGEQVPLLVQRAMALAEKMGFVSSCTPEVGRLLATLSATCSGAVGELGTGCGVGTAWLAYGLPAGAQLVTVEMDPAKAQAVRELFADNGAVQVLTGDWHELLSHGPFDLLFADVKQAKADEPERLLSALKPGGVVLIDDLTPLDRWPDEWKGQPDSVREFWLNDPRLVATEIGVGEAAAILAVMRSRAARF